MSKTTVRNKTIPVALSEAELSEVAKVIQGSGLTRSAFFRAAILKTARSIRSKNGLVRLHLEAVREGAAAS